MGKNSQHRTARRVLAAAAGIMLVAQQAQVATAEPRTLCQVKGSYSCLTFSGYGERTGTWADTRYPGNNGNHSCSRYVAYRLAKGGMREQASWGDASQWIQRAPGHKDKTPTVGAVAYWNQQWTATYWGHSEGHVGVVEKVNADGSIEVTWDSQREGMVVRKIITRGPDMPTDFIHIDDGSIRRSGGDETKTPPTKTDTPSTSTNTPPTKTDTPPTSTDTPPSKTDTPPTSTDTPPTSTSTPPTKTDTPPTSTDTPKTSTSVPPTGSLIPPSTAPSKPDTPASTTPSEPTTTTDTPPSKTDTPKTSTDTPPSKTDTPPTSTSTPPTATDTPKTSDSEQPPKCDKGKSDGKCGSNNGNNGSIGGGNSGSIGGGNSNGKSQAQGSLAGSGGLLGVVAAVIGLGGIVKVVSNLFQRITGGSTGNSSGSGGGNGNSHSQGGSTGGGLFSRSS
ncbi:CHAP domain-containing protein [Corynebacterium matruchotii]|uniref:CHAP domain-containing protein n=1 Tax=Corynebacterium matruchotii TaxID=43768 RepID=UPI0028E333DD|nr:CHAP domain-containing protein [Corynebacterium matruchotii]